MQVDTKVPLHQSAYSPTISRRNREQNLLSASLNGDEYKYNEKTVYRSQKFPDLKENTKNSFSRCSTAAPFPRHNSGYDNEQANEERAQSSKPRSKRNHKKDADNVNWNNLGGKIEDWFECAKTPDQKIVYRFLKDIKDEDFGRDDASSVMSSGSQIADKAQSLEDILDNLKKYRNKFNRVSKAGASNNGERGNKSRANTSLPKLRNDEYGGNKSIQNLNNSMFESSTWRVMRHLKSADIRNKYPLPKANPDYHFRNATIFHTCGRPPKSTFLLHPDWV